MSMFDVIYPVTIIRVRYGGVYERCEWAAFYCYPYDFPYEAMADDCTCMDWWGEHGNGVGKGSSPSDAVKNLEEIPEAGRWQPWQGETHD